jgi:hypothetical protein
LICPSRELLIDSVIFSLSPSSLRGKGKTLRERRGHLALREKLREKWLVEIVLNYSKLFIPHTFKKIYDCILDVVVVRILIDPFIFNSFFQLIPIYIFSIESAVIKDFVQDLFKD